ncbi:unnamed protein product, partial [Urochloa humidicola]
MELIDDSVDRRHRAFAHVTEGNDAVPVLRARAPRKAWPLHPQWLPRLHRAGLLPLARMVEATGEDAADDEVEEHIERSRHFPYDQS